MPRNMSFALTTVQFRNQSKTVTRRLGWKFIKPGEQVTGCEKCQGLKKGENIVKLGLIEIVETRWEPLRNITQEDCILEGFPDFTPQEFIEMFCDHNKCFPQTLVNRIQFKYLQMYII